MDFRERFKKEIYPEISQNTFFFKHATCSVIMESSTFLTLFVVKPLAGVATCSVLVINSPCLKMQCLNYLTVKIGLDEAQKQQQLLPNCVQIFSFDN